MLEDERTSDGCMNIGSTSAHLGSHWAAIDENWPNHAHFVVAAGHLGGHLWAACGRPGFIEDRGNPAKIRATIIRQKSFAAMHTCFSLSAHCWYV
jgi:hypothetical protein